jgi:hypothetical protein
LTGLAANYVRVTARGDADLKNKFVRVLVESADETLTTGTIVAGSER